MSNTNDPPPGSAPTAQPGPDLLSERTLSGIFVHLFGLFTGVVGPGIVYLVSDHEFTRRNARAAINWQLFYFLSFVAVIALLFGVMVLEFVLPDLVVVTVFLVAFVLLFGVMFLTLLNLAFPLVATGKAIFGTAWEYPIAPDFFELDRDSLRIDLAWWKFVLVYALVAPLLFVQLLATVALGGLQSGAQAGAFFVTLILVTLISFLAAISLYRDEAEFGNGANWRPPRISHLRVPVAVIPYLGIPVGTYLLVYLISGFLLRSENPSGDAMYSYLFALWAAAVVYLYRRRASARGT